MLEKTVLNEESIRKILKENFNLEVKKVNHLDRGSSNIFILDDEYVLKEFSSDRNVSLIEKECGVIEYLANKGIRVPEYVKTINNENYVIIDGKIIIVQKFLSGYTIENNTGDYDKTIESARMLGELQKALSEYDWKYSKEYNEFVSKEEIEENITKLTNMIDKINNDNPYRDKIIEDLNLKIEISKQILKTFDFNEVKKVSIMLCHGDYSIQQLLFDDKESTAILDFETLKYMPVVWEIIRSYSYVDECCIDGNFNLDNFINYVKEVLKFIRLNEYDLKYMPYIYLMQLSGSTYGYKQYNEDYSKIGLLYFAFFRTNACKYLFSNMNLISKELLKLNDNN